MSNKTNCWLATVGLIGFFPYAPGTAASLVTVVLVWLLSLLIGSPSGWGLLAAATGIYFIGVPAARDMEKELGRKDPRPVVIDEVAGQLIALAFVPLTWLGMLLSFFFFRAFDIIKPFPINWLDKNLPGGWGIMTDDVLAGLFALGCTHLALHYIQI